MGSEVRTNYKYQCTTISSTQNFDSCVIMAQSVQLWPDLHVATLGSTGRCCEFTGATAPYFPLWIKVTIMRRILMLSASFAIIGMAGPRVSRAAPVPDVCEEQQECRVSLDCEFTSICNRCNGATIHPKGVCGVFGGEA